MPDNVDARGAADGNAVHSDDNSPDLVGEELGDGARIWRVYDQVAREEDRERIGTWNRGLDNLALFAGLFSAVTTAFIIQLQQDTQPDYARLTFLVLNASAAGAPFHDEPFAIDRDVRTTNCLWISSLMLSLTAALIAIMGKDWIGMYASRPVCNPRQWAEIRTYRVACVERWYMSGVIASAPVLLHISLVLFSAGLVIFVSSDPLSQRVALGLALAAGALYGVTVLSAILFPTSPFKSPATQTVRGALGSVYTFLYDCLVCRPKRNPVGMLQQATLLIGATLSYTLPDTILPMDRSQSRRVRAGDLRVVLNHVFSPRRPAQIRSWRAFAARMATAPWTRSVTFARSLPALSQSVVDRYNYWRQRPRPRPWHTSVASHLRQIDLSDRWVEVRTEPTPAVLAQSLSHLNAMAQSTDVLRSIIVALGDISIGRDVAALVSFDLKTRLANEIRHNWPKKDLVTLSRYLLAALHLPDTPLMPFPMLLQFSGDGDAIKSESIVFALVELSCSLSFSIDLTINKYFPDILIQPRAVHYLLPKVYSHETVIVLTLAYYDHLDRDQRMRLGDELRSRLIPWADDYAATFEEKLNRRFGCRAGLLELLVFFLDFMSGDMIAIAVALIFKALDGKKYWCLASAFGHESPRVSDAAWAALPADYNSAHYYDYHLLESALPLGQFVPHGWAKSVTTPVSDEQRLRDVCLLRAIVMLLFPSRPFANAMRHMRNDPDEFITISTLELSVRCLRALLHSRSAPNSQEYLGIITLMLENAVLIRVSALWSVFRGDDSGSTAERNVINILTAIARRLAALLPSGGTDDDATGAKLFCLFSFSQATDYAGRDVVWDLGSYLRDVAGRLSEQDPGTRLSLSRLISVLRTLRPLCTLREDIRSSWEYIGLPADDDYQESFWDAEDFELGPLLDPDAHVTSDDSASSPEETTRQVATDEWTALCWLNAAMH